MPSSQSRTWDPTLGELARRIDHVDNTMRGIRAEIIGRDLYEAHRQQHTSDLMRVHERLDEMDADRKWMRRLLVGVLLTALVSLAAQVIAAGLT